MIGNREFRRIYLMQILLAVADAVALNFMMLYLVTLGFKLEQLLLATTLGFSTPVVLIAVMRRARAKVSFSVAFAGKILAYLVAMLWLRPATINLIYMCNALVLVFFWVPYNLEFFSYVSERTKAYSGSIAIAIYPLVGLAVPPVAGYIWHARGFTSNMLLAISVLAGSIIYMLLNRSIKIRKFDYGIAKSLSRLKRYRTLFLLQGLWEASTFVGVPVFTLVFVRTELKLGLFLSYLGVLSVVATVAIARLSDRSNRRTTFLYPAVLLTAGATMALFLARSAILWVALVGLLNFSAIVTTPFLIAVALDAKVAGIDMWAGRELLLNLGRSLGAAIILIIYRIGGDYRPAFLVLGGMLLLYAGVLHLKQIYPRARIFPSQPAR